MAVVGGSEALQVEADRADAVSQLVDCTNGNDRPATASPGQLARAPLDQT